MVENPKLTLFVIPANPGSGTGQTSESNKFNVLLWSWTPVFTGVRTFYDIIIGWPSELSGKGAFSQRRQTEDAM
jgi:hypothetical protein